MAIKTIDIKNVMVFQHCVNQEEDHTFHNEFTLEFCDGINVLIGENGVGKTTILKMIYAAAQWSIEQNNPKKALRFLQLFSASLRDDEALKSTDRKNEECYYRVSDSTHSFQDSLSCHERSDIEDWMGLNIQSVFIPTTEMLSHAKGFLALNQKYNMPFDGTQVDIIVNASLPETREIPEAMYGILEKISAVIDGTVIFEEDSFYVRKKDGKTIDFSLEAEGLRKLGLLWKLIRNGLLEKGTILLWDEPEANLNPELYALVAEILLELQKYGVQIFVATHSYNFSKYLELRRTNEEQVMFHNLYREYTEISDDLQDDLIQTDENHCFIRSQSAYKMDEIQQNHIMLADNRLLDEIYDL